MRTIEHYVLINGKVICELVSKDEMNVSRASVGTESMNGGRAPSSCRIGRGQRYRPAPETSDER